jgi:glycosyltransferase involved in cell wall biosynthesis
MSNLRVRYYGHVGALSGYGRAGADLCMSLLATGKVDLEISPIDYRADEARIALAGAREALIPHCRKDHDLTEPDVVIVHTLPRSVAAAADRVTSGLEAVATPVVAYTTWEGCSPVPEEMQRDLDGVDQLWVPSGGTAAAFAAFADDEVGKIRVIPHAVDPDTLGVRRLLAFDLNFAFRFYYQGAWTSRKNPAGLLRAWALAFSADDRGVGLYLYCPGGEQTAFAVAMHQTGLKVQDMAPVIFDSGRKTEDEIFAMHREGDCFVTASRGESWNLPCFDAMLAGRHIISTAGLGSDDYLTETGADRVDGFLMPATVDVRVTGAIDGGVTMQTVGAQGLTSRSAWIEPDLVRMAELMRHAYRRRHRELAMAYDPFERYSYQAVGALALNALENLA